MHTDTLRTAAIYDIHGNLPALEAVLRDVAQAGVDRLLIGGDIVTGPMPRECLACLRGTQLPTHFIRGNGEREVVAAFDGDTLAHLPAFVQEAALWTARQLGRADRDFLANLPETLVLNVIGLGEVLFCHGSPRSDEDIITPATPPARVVPMLSGITQSVVVCGHTHMPFDRVIEGVRLVNAGSVGMPYGETGAYWALLGPDVQLMRSRYDLADAVARIRATTYPQAEDFAANNILQVPTEQEAIDAFEPPMRDGDR